jgi:hypothetical protein
VRVLPDPAPVNLKDIKWVVISNKKLPTAEEWVYISLTPKEYEELAQNQAELLRWIKEAKWRLEHYRKQYE